MPTIEQRVVEMRFDNKQFEDNAEQSISTLDKLNKSLDFKESSKGLEKLENAASKFKLSGMEMALNTITEKFSALEIAGITAIQNLTNKAVNWGTGMLKSFTVEPLTTGWDKYAQKTSAVQTIMSATAKDIEDEGERMKFVNEQMDQLSWFTDETSYSLVDMTSNIGKFTSNGIKLDKAVTQMEGISVWASLSGASLSDASRAMYNLSQAMSSGQVKAIDWMSIENANMATREFKEAAIEAAVQLGTLKKTAKGYTDATGKAADVTKDFRGSLAQGWFTDKVLSKTLNRFGAFTGKLKEFQDAFEIDTASEAIKWIDDYAEGTFKVDEQARKLGVDSKELKKYLDELSSSEMDLGRRAFKAAQEAKTFGEAIDATKEAVSSGWMQTFEYIFGDYLEAKKLWTNLANELYDVFAGGAYDRNQILKLWHNGLEDTVSGYETLMEAFSNIWDGLKNFASIISDAWEAVFPSAETYEEAARPLIALTEKFRDISEKLKNYFGELRAPLNEVVESIQNSEAAKALETAKEGLSVVDKTKEKLEELAKRTRKLEFGNGEERIKKIREMGYSYEVVQNEVNRQIEAEAAARGESVKLIRHAIREKDKEKKKIEDVTASEEALMEAYKEAGIIVNEDGSFQYGYWTEAEKRAMTLHQLFVNFFQAIEVGKKIIEGVGKVAWAVVQHLWEMFEGPFWNALDKVTDAVSDFFEEFEPAYKVEDFFEGLIPIVEQSIDVIADFFRNIWHSEGIGKLIDSLKSLGDMFSDIFGKIFGRLKERSAAIDWYKTVTVILDKIVDVISFVAESISKAIDFIVSQKDRVIGFLKGIDKAIPMNLDDVPKIFEDLKNGLKGFGGTAGQKAGEILSKLGAIISKNFSDPRSPIRNAINTVKDFAKKLVEMIASFDLSKFGKIAKGGGLAALGIIIFKFVKGIVDAVSGIASIPKKIFGVFDDLSGTLESYQKKLNSESLLNIAKAIGILVLSLIGLALIPAEDMTRVVSALIMIGAVVAALMLAFSKLKGAKKDTGILETIMDPVKNFLDGVKGTLEKLGKMIGMAAIIIAVAVGVGILIGIINSLMDVPWGKFLSAMTMMLLAMGTLVGAAILLSKYAKKFDFSIGAGLVAMAFAVKILVSAVQPLAELDFFALLQGVGAIGVLMLGMAEAARMAADSDITTFGASMFVAAMAIKKLVKPIETLGSMDFFALLQGVGAVGLIVAAMVGMAITLSEHDGASKELMTLAKALKTLAIPMLLIGAFAKTAAIGLGLIAGTMVVLLIAGFIADKVAVGLETLSISLIQIGAGAVIFGIGAALIGVGCLAIAKALTMVVQTIPMFIDALIYLGSAILEHGQELFVGFTTLLGIIAVAIIAAAPGLGSAVVSLITSIGASIVGSLPILSVQAFALIMGLLMFLYSIAGPTVNSILDILVAAIHALADGLRNHAAPIFSALGDLLDACFDLIVEALASVIDLIPIFGKSWGDGIRGAKDWVQPVEEMAADVSAAAEKGMSGTGDNVKETLNAEFSGADFASIANEYGESTGGSFGGGVEKGLQSYMEEAGFSDDVMNMFSSNQGLFEQSGTDSANSFLGGWGTALDSDESAEMSVQTLFGNLTNGGAVEEKIMSVGDENGQTYLDSIMSKITGSQDDVGDTMEDAIDTAGNAANEEASIKGPESGSYWVAGVDKGVRSGDRTLYNAGWHAADTLDSGYRARSKTESPSKVAMQNGKFWDQGLALGIIGNASLISSAGEKSANTLMDTMRGVLDSITSVINDETELNPTITPVLDLSEIQNGTSLLNGMLGNRSYNLATSSGMTFEANRLEALNRLETNSTNADVVAALGLLRGDVNNLNTAMNGMQVVMDSGQLVGAIAQPMDNALGRRNTYRGRGI